MINRVLMLRMVKMFMPIMHVLTMRTHMLLLLIRILRNFLQRFFDIQIYQKVDIMHQDLCVILPNIYKQFLVELYMTQLSFKAKNFIFVNTFRFQMLLDFAFGDIFGNFRFLIRKILYFFVDRLDHIIGLLLAAETVIHKDLEHLHCLEMRSMAHVHPTERGRWDELFQCFDDQVDELLNLDAF